MWFLPPSLPLGPAALPTFPLALLLAAMLWPTMASVIARRLGLDGEAISLRVYRVAIAALLGSRVALFAVYPRDFLATPRALLSVGGPIARWGAFVGAVLALAWLVWRRRGEVLATLDVATAAVPLPLALAAFGWSDPGAIPAVLGFGLAGLVLLSARARARRGQPLLAALMLLAIVAFALPWFRLASPDTVTIWPGWTWLQWGFLCAGLVAGLGLWLIERPEPPQQTVGPDPGKDVDDNGST